MSKDDPSRSMWSLTSNQPPSGGYPIVSVAESWDPFLAASAMLGAVT